MNRSTFVLGFAFLVIAATLAATITLRNAPAPADSSAVRGGPREAAPRAAIAGHRGTALVGENLSPAARAARRSVNESARRERPQVSLPEAWLAGLTAEQQQAWRDRVQTVQRDACRQLDRLTEDLALSPEQTRKAFPAIVRSLPGYDPVMSVAGGLAAQTPAAATEAIHDMLDPEQQALIEKREVDRQLWWQDILARLEADLVDSTGGMCATVTAADPDTPPDSPPAPDPAPADDQDRTPPESHGTTNLFDLMDGGR